MTVDDTEQTGCLDCGNVPVADGLCPDCHEYYDQYELIRHD